MLRKAMLASVAAAAVSVPVAIWQSDNIGQLTGLSETAAEDTAPNSALPTLTPTEFGSAVPAPGYDPTQLSPEAAPLPLAHQDGLPADVGPTVDLKEVLRMDITRAWVLQRWGRVTTAVADTNHDGLRVALVSGTSAYDLCGSLTYYFDQSGRLQRIAFHGTVGNPQRLVDTLTNEFDFGRQPTLGGELYTRTYFGNATGICRLRPAAVMRAESPLTQYEVILELNRNGFGTELSDAAQRLLAS